MPPRLPVKDLIRLGPSKEEVDIMFPGESNSTMELQCLTTKPSMGVGDIRSGHGDRFAPVDRIIAESQGCIVGRRSHCFEGDQKIS